MRGATPFIDTGRADRFLRTGVHALVGNSFVTQNYKGCFPEITELSLSPGWAMGMGATAEFAVRDYLWIGTEANVMINNYNTDLIVNRANATSVSNVFLRSHFYSLNFPVYLSFKFNLADKVRWNVDGGLYYGYGLGGTQRQAIYNARINEIGQLLSSHYELKSHYYNDSDGFINSIKRADVGVHLASGLTFYQRVSVGVRAEIGLKNAAKTIGEVHPNLHNFSFLVSGSYWF